MSYKFPITVLTTAHNAGLYIEDAISSILTQSFSNFEFIILDDRSTDNTLEIIEKFAKRDTRVKVIKNKVNKGISFSRNRLIDMAQGKYVVWQDADDISLPDRIESLYNFMELNPAVGICGGYLQFFDAAGDLSIRKYKTDDQSLRKNIFKYSPVAQPTAIIRKEVFDKVGKYDINFSSAEDIDMSFRIGEHFEFANLPKIILRYRQHQSSSTFKQLAQMERNTFIIRKKFYNNKKYQPYFIDYAFNFVQLITFYFLPSRLRIGLFNLVRNF